MFELFNVGGGVNHNGNRQNLRKTKWQPFCWNPRIRHLSMLHRDCYHVLIGIKPYHQKPVLSISFRDWQHMFLVTGLNPLNTRICFMNNGKACGYSKWDRSVRQGDPASPDIFTMIIELLIIEIRNTLQILGVQIFNQELSLNIWKMHFIFAPLCRLKPVRYFENSVLFCLSQLQYVGCILFIY